MLTISSRILSAVGLTSTILLLNTVVPGRLLADLIVDTGPGTGVVGYTLDPKQSQAARFNVTAPVSLNSIELYMLNADPSAVPKGHFKIEVRTFTGGDDYSSAGLAGVTPETSIGSVLYSGEFQSQFIDAYEWQGLFGLDWVLNAGSYWVTFSSDGPTGGVRERAPHPLTDYAFTRDGDWYDGDFVRFGVRIAGSPVPDNFSTIGFFAFGFMGLALFKRSIPRIA